MTVETLMLTTQPGAVNDYQSIYAQGSDVSKLSATATASVMAHRFKRMLLFDRHSDGLAHHRSLPRVKRDGNDHMSIHLLVEGGLVGGPPGSRRELKPGEMLVFDTSLPMWSQAIQAHYVTAWVARDQVEKTSVNLRSFGGARLPEATCGLLGDFMRMVSHRAPTMSPAMTEGVSRMIGDLLVATLSGAVLPLERALSDDVVVLMRQERIEAFIMSRLSDPNLGLQHIEAGTGMSRSSIYRAFQDVGGVVRFIQERRVLAFRDALRRRGETRSISSLAYACGFKSVSHSNRLFRDALGMSPGEFRAGFEGRRLPSGPRGPWSDSFSHWLHELY